MTTALPFPDRIHASSNRAVKFRTLTAQFGDGYSQRVPDGLNSRVESWSITWVGLSQADYATVIAVLDTVGSTGVLTWTPPTESAIKKYIMANDGYRDTKTGTRWSVSCNLTQVF